MYKAVLDDGQMVAIKRAEQGSMRSKAGFTTEIELLSRFHHNNVLDLIGFCVECGERTLVYNYIPYGSLEDILLGKTAIQLNWASRVRIALGSARALEYLHYDVNPCVIHRNVKSSNILVDDHLTAKVAHFDLAQILHGGPNEGVSQVISTQIAGTLGYLDPEYLSTGQLSLNSDVYSFGVLLLELITARPARDVSGGLLVTVVKTALETWGISVLKEELMDPLLSDSLPVGFERFLNLALTCVQELGFQRPSMSNVVKELEAILAGDGDGDGDGRLLSLQAILAETETGGFSHSSAHNDIGQRDAANTIEDDMGSRAEEGR